MDKENENKDKEEIFIAKNQLRTEPKEDEHFLVKLFASVVNPIGLLIMLYALECGLKVVVFKNELTLLDLGPKLFLWSVGCFFTLWATTASYQTTFIRLSQKDLGVGMDKEYFKISDNEQPNKRHQACLAGLFFSLILMNLDIELISGTLAVMGGILAGKTIPKFLYSISDSFVTLGKRCSANNLQEALIEDHLNNDMSVFNDKIRNLDPMYKNIIFDSYMKKPNNESYEEVRLALLQAYESFECHKVERECKIENISANPKACNK